MSATPILNLNRNAVRRAIDNATTNSKHFPNTKHRNAANNHAMPLDMKTNPLTRQVSNKYFN